MDRSETHGPPTHARATGRTVGLTLAAGLLLVAGGGMLAAQPRAGRGLAAPEGGGGPGLWVHSTPLEDGRHLLVVIDGQGKGAAVYHVDPVQGSLTLKSTRNLGWDLLVQEYNAQDPRPTTLRRMLETAGESLPAGQKSP